MSDKADEFFLHARELTDPEERAAFLAKVCRNDPKILMIVQGLLASESHAESYFAGMDSKNDDRAKPLAANSQTSERPGEHEGQMIGRYKLLQRLGEGGFGIVWMAEQTEPVSRKVALKIIKQGMDTQEVIARFEAERQALAMMDHPHIAKVLDAGATDTGRPFFVMELVKGLPVTEFCNRRKLDLRQRLQLFGEICSAVNHAHQKGIIHRDLKPSNVMVTLHGDKAVPMVIDFGIAKATMGKLTDKTLFTRYDQFIGTPVYMSPEQAALSGLDLDTRSDIYALGILLYELLTGKPPFEAKRLLNAGFDEMRRIIQEDEPLRPSVRLSSTVGEDADLLTASHRADPDGLSRFVRGDLDWIVMKAISKDRERRYQTANGLAMDIQRFLADEPVTATPPSVGYRLRKAWRRNQVIFSAVTAVVVSLLIGTVVSSRQAFRATKEAERATAAETLAAQRLVVSENALKEAKMLSATNREQLIQMYTARGVENLRSGRSALALPWLVKALELDGADTDRQHLNRVRIGQVLNRVPRLYRFWSKPGSASLVQFNADGNYVLALASDMTGIDWSSGGLGLWAVSTGESVDLAMSKREVLHAAFSPDGARLATLESSGEIRVWDLAARRPLIKFESPDANGHHLVFSPDGAYLLCYGRHGLARLWNAQNGRLLIAHFEVKDSINFRGADFSPDGHQVSILDYHGGSSTFDVLTGRPLLPVAGNGFGGGFRLQYSPDGRFFATPVGGMDTIHLWDSKTAAAIATLRHPYHVSSFDISPDGTAVGSAVRDFGGVLQVWDSKTGKSIAPPAPQETPVAEVRFSPDSKHIVTASWNGVAQVWNASTGKAVGSPMWHSAALQSVDYHPSGRYILTGCVDGTVRMWAISLGPSPVLTLKPETQLEHIALDRSGRRLLTSNVAGDVQTWETAVGAGAWKSNPTVEVVANAGILPDTNLIRFLDHEPVVQFWNSDTEDARGDTLASTQKLAWSKGFLPTIAVTPDGTKAVFMSSAPGESRFQIWNLAQRLPTAEVVTASPISLFQMSSDGRSLAIVAANAKDRKDTISFWSTETGHKIGETIAIETHATAGAFSPDGGIFALVSQGIPNQKRPDFAVLEAWKVRSGEVALSRSSHSGNPGILRYHPAGKTIAISHDNTLRVFDATTGRPLTAPMLHDRPVLDVRFSPDGGYLCSIDGTELLYVHDAASGQPMTVPIKHPGTVRQALFTPDSLNIVTACDDGLVRFWEFAPEQRPVRELTLQAQLLSGHQLDETGALSPLSTKACELQWGDWLKTMPAGLTSIPDAALIGEGVIAGLPGRMAGPRAKALQAWNRLEGRLVTVSSDPRVPNSTGIILREGDWYRLFPCPTDTWNTSPERWPDVDYRGHNREPTATSGGRPFMQLCYAIGTRKLEAVGNGKTISGVGELSLMPSDVEGGGNSANNKGYIRVKIVKVN